METYRFNIGDYPIEYLVGTERLEELIKETEHRGHPILRVAKEGCAKYSRKLLGYKPQEFSAMLEQTNEERPLRILQAHGDSTKKGWDFHDQKDIWISVPGIIEHDKRTSGWIIQVCNPGDYVLKDSSVPVIYPSREVSMEDVGTEECPLRVAGLGDQKGKLKTALDFLKSAWAAEGMDRIDLGPQITKMVMAPYEITERRIRAIMEK